MDESLQKAQMTQQRTVGTLHIGLGGKSRHNVLGLLFPQEVVNMVCLEGGGDVEQFGVILCLQHHLVHAKSEAM